MYQLPTATGPTDISQLARAGSGPSQEKAEKGFQDLMNNFASVPAAVSQAEELIAVRQEAEIPEAVTSELFKRVSGLLETALEINKAIKADASPDQLSQLKREFSTALLQLARDLRDIPLNARLEVAAQVSGDLDVNLDIRPLTQILEHVDPLEALRQLTAKSLMVLSKHVIPEGKHSGSIVALPNQSPNEGKFLVSSAVPESAIKGLGFFLELTVQQSSNGNPVSLIDMAPQEPAARNAGVPAASFSVPIESRVSELPAQGKDGIEVGTGSGAAALSGLEKQQKDPVQRSPSLNIELSKAGTTSQAVGLSTPLGQAVEVAEARASAPLESPTRTPVSADPSASYMFARTVAAQIRGKVFEEGKTRVELSPRGLGDVEVEVSRDEAGKLRVILRVENPAVLTAFRQDREALLSTLREGGFEIEESELSFEDFDGHGFQQQFQDSHADSKPRSVSKSTTSIEQTQDMSPPGRAMSVAPSGLNIVT